MLYRLGDFYPQPGTDSYSIGLRDLPAEGGTQTDVLEKMVRIRMLMRGEFDTDSLGPDDNEPRFADVLSRLPAEDADSRRASIVHRVLSDLNANGVAVQLLTCEHEPGPDGYFAIAASLPDRFASIRPGDVHQAGFALLRTGNETTVSPRLFRLVCSNGLLISRWSEDTVVTDEAHLASLVRMSLSQPVFEQAIAALAEAAERPADDPWLLRHEFERVIRQMIVEDAADDTWDAMMEGWEEDGDATAYGLLNALTAVARDAKDFRARLALEEFAGRLARLKPPTPRRSGVARAELVTSG